MKEKRTLPICNMQADCRACNEDGNCVALNDTSEVPCKFYKKRKYPGDDSWAITNLRVE